MALGHYKNALLIHLDKHVVSRLNLHPVTFELGHELEFPGRPLKNLFFVEEGMASMTVTFEDGAQVEVGMFGFESVVGISGLMGTKRSLNRVYTQIAGHGFSCSMEVARSEFCRGEQFQALALRYVQAQLVQSLQCTACNLKHDIEQRLARWLLTCAERSNSNSFRMSHELLADMLGNTRASVSLAAGVFKDRGLIDYNRGAMRILDVPGLEARSCECYRIIKDHLHNYLEFDTGMEK